MEKLSRFALAAVLALLSAALLIGAAAALFFAAACALTALAFVFIAAPKECRALLAYLKSAVARCEEQWLALARQIFSAVAGFGGAAAAQEAEAEAPAAPGQTPADLPANASGATEGRPSGPAPKA